MGTDESTINNIIGRRSYEQRMQIKIAYERRYKKDLVQVLSSETSGHYESLIKTLFQNQIDILAYSLFNHMKKLGSHLNILNEIICCCNNSEIEMLKKAYKRILRSEDPKKFASRSLETDIGKEIKGPHKQFILELLKCKREEVESSLIEEAIRTRNTNLLINKDLVFKDIECLEGASQKHLKPEVYIVILATRSKYHIKGLWDAYKTKHGYTIVDTIVKTFSEPLKSAFTTTVMALIDLRLLVTCQLFNSMHGTGTRENSLIRIVALKCEHDLNLLKNLYEEYFGNPLTQSIRDNTSGDFSNLLLILLGE